MSYEQISALIDRYFEGETTLEEERQLKVYFAQTPLPDSRLETVAPLFRMLKAEQAVQAPAQRPVQWSVQTGGHYPMRRLLAAASVAAVVGLSAWWLWNTAPTGLSTAPLAGNTVAPTVAALQPAENPTVVVAAAVPENTSSLPKKLVKMIRRKHAQPALDEQERQEAEAALAEVKAALALVSRKLNRGRHEATKHLNAVETLNIVKTNS